MLSSPGNSPRHILPSPSCTPRLQNDPLRDLIAGPLPYGKRKRPQVVLDEDTYVDAIEKIIERDYFTDLPKLHDCLEWLEAICSEDPMQIKDVQLKIIERKQARVCRVSGGPDQLMMPMTSVRNPFETPAMEPSPAPTMGVFVRS